MKSRNIATRAATLGTFFSLAMLAATAPVLAAEPAQTGSASPTLAGLKPPLHGLDEVGYQDVRLKGGFWGPRLDRHHQTTIPHVLDKLVERHHVTNFDLAARVIQSGTSGKGAADGDEATRALEGNAGNQATEDKKTTADDIVGHSAFDSDVHKALEGACYTLGHADDPALRKRIDSILDRILAAQEDNGYLVSYFTAKEPDQKWGNMRLNHEMYNAGHFFEFAVAHHQLDGSTKALEAAKRFANHIDDTFGPGKRYEVGGHQEIELALIKLYRATGESRYLDLCSFLLDERGHAHGSERRPFTEVIPRGDPKRLPGQTVREWRRGKWSMRNGRMQDHKPLLEQTEAVGHAVRAGYMYAAMADLARFSDAPEYAEAVRTLWEDVVFRKLFITGGIGTAQYGDEGFGDPYLLPNRTYCESCASIAHVFWQHRMTLLTGEAKYADAMELVLYNSALSGMSLEGDSYFYQNPLESRNGAERSEWIGLACCPTNLSRFTPQVGGYVYAHVDNQLFVNLFAAGEATVPMDSGRGVRITQETNYPWDGRIQLTVAPDEPSDFDLCVRIPGWATGRPVPGDLYRFADPQTAPVALKVNGESVEAKPGPDGYIHLERSWKPGDLVELDLPMPVRRVLAHEKVEANRGKVALMRGPVVYCLEGVDNKDVDLFELSLPRTSKLSAEHRPDLLNGVTVIAFEGVDENKKPVQLTAIPYYAWANREKGPMTIWIDETADSVKASAERWPVEKAWEWYRDQPWPCGFNYIPANAISYTEMWMPYCFDPELIDKELALAEDVGFNCLRVVLPFVVWEHDPEAFKNRLSTFLDLCDKRGLKVMPCFFDDCAFGSDKKLKDPWYGKQPEVLEGWYASGWTPSPGHGMVRDPETWPRLEKYVTDLMTTFKDDSRVWVWDLYNEPTNGGLGDTSLPLAAKVFRWARAVAPSQPLTLATWNGNEKLNDLIVQNSDIITFHNYGNAAKLDAHIQSLKKHGRPLINTEWLNRGRESTVSTCLPLFAKENVGCMHWGLVNGKTQTDLGWGWRPGRPEPEVWQHDLFHGDHKPYDEQELNIFRRTIEKTRLEDPVTGASVLMKRNKDGGVGLSVVTAEKTLLGAPYPLHVELSDGEQVTDHLNRGYDDASIENGVMQAHGSITRGDVAFRFRDTWKIEGFVLVLDREVLVEGNLEGGFMTGIRFRYPEPLKRDQLKIFAPGMIYGTSDHLPPGAIGGSDHKDFVRIREDRLPAPLFGAYSENGTSFTVMNSRPDARTTKEDSRARNPRTLIDERFRFGAIGADFNGDHPVFGYWFPGSEGGVTYRCSSHYDGQSEQWSRRYHPVKDGLRQEYQVSFRVGFDPSFRDYYHKTWRWAWDILKPAVNPQDIGLARRSLTNMLGERVVTHNGITGIRKIRGLPLREEFPQNSRFHQRSTMGFTGAAVQAAGYLLADSLAADNPHGERNRERGEAVVRQFLKLELAPPAGEGFYFDTGKPGVTRPLRRLPEPIVFLRSFGDGLKSLMQTVEREKAAGRERPEWVAWARSFADWLLPQQNPDGSFPRSWKQGTGEVYHRFPESTYTVITFLVLLSEITDDERYADAARKAGEYCWNSSHKHGVFIGATLDQPNVIDKEAGTISLEAYLALYRLTSDQKWLQRAMAAASFAETWIYVWNVPMPEDEEDRDLVWKKGIPTVGMQGIATGHSLTDMYMAFDVDEFAELYLHTGDKHYYDVAMILLHNTKAMLALPDREFDLPGPGWMQEHWSLAPTRGVGSLRAWLTWVTASQLNGIVGLEELDRDLFLKMSGASSPVDSPNERADKVPAVDRTGETKSFY